MRQNSFQNTSCRLSATGYLLLGLTVCIAFPHVFAEDHVQVDTKYGPVKGNVKDGVNVFNSIPFAKPPTGERRFKPPEAPDSWKDPVDAWKLSWVCPQIKIIGGLFLVSCTMMHLQSLRFS